MRPRRALAPIVGDGDDDGGGDGELSLRFVRGVAGFGAAMTRGSLDVRIGVVRESTSVALLLLLSLLRRLLRAIGSSLIYPTCPNLSSLTCP